MSAPRKKTGKHRATRRRLLVAALKETQKTLRSGLVMVERLQRQLERDWTKVVVTDQRHVAMLERSDPEYGGVGAGDASFEDMPEMLSETLTEALAPRRSLLRSLLHHRRGTMAKPEQWLRYSFELPKGVRVRVKFSTPMSQPGLFGDLIPALRGGMVNHEHQHSSRTNQEGELLPLELQQFEIDCCIVAANLGNGGEVPDEAPPGIAPTSKRCIPLDGPPLGPAGYAAITVVNPNERAGVLRATLYGRCARERDRLFELAKL